jgi:hypothetical protein
MADLTNNTEEMKIMNVGRKLVLLVLSLGLLVVGSPLTARGEITKVTLKVAGMT